MKILGVIHKPRGLEWVRGWFGWGLPESTCRVKWFTRGYLVYIRSRHFRDLIYSFWDLKNRPENSCVNWQLGPISKNKWAEIVISFSPYYLAILKSIFGKFTSKYEAYAISWFYVICCPLSFPVGFPQHNHNTFCLRWGNLPWRQREDNKNLKSWNCIWLPWNKKKLPYNYFHRIYEWPLVLALFLEN